MTKEELNLVPNCPGIYLLTNTVNNKNYVGQSVCLIRRLKQHYSNCTNPRFKTKHLYASMNKYGIDKFKITILEVLDPLKEPNILKTLNTLEIAYIEKYKGFTDGYNETKGGESENGCNHSPEIALKISKALKEYYSKPENKVKYIKYTYGYNIKEHYFIEANSRYELSIILKEKGYNLAVSDICSVILDRNHSSKGFIFGNTKEECLEKLKFFDTDLAKHSNVYAPNYNEYLEYLKTIADKNGYLPAVEKIAEHYQKARTTIVGWNNKIRDELELDKYYNRLKLKNYSNPDIDYKLRETKKMYLIYDTINDTKYVLNTLEMSKFFNITMISIEGVIKRNVKTNKLYRKQYLISENDHI